MSEELQNLVGVEIPDDAAPCPFCRQRDLHVAHNEAGDAFINCLSCEAEGPTAPDKEGAWRVWNDRGQRLLVSCQGCGEQVTGQALAGPDPRCPRRGKRLA
jgi:hypothetical protein